MSSPRTVISPKARKDLEDLETYIAELSGELRAAATMERLDKAIRNLNFMPGIGSRRYYLKRNQRAFFASPWTIFYEELPERNGINVMRIVDGRRNLPALFGKKKR